MYERTEDRDAYEYVVVNTITYSFRVSGRTVLNTVVLKPGFTFEVGTRKLKPFLGVLHWLFFDKDTALKTAIHDALYRIRGGRIRDAYVSFEGPYVSRKEADKVSFDIVAKESVLVRIKAWCAWRVVRWFGSYAWND